MNPPEFNVNDKKIAVRTTRHRAVGERVYIERYVNERGVSSYNAEDIAMPRESVYNNHSARTIGMGTITAIHSTELIWVERDGEYPDYKL